MTILLLNDDYVNIWFLHNVWFQRRDPIVFDGRAHKNVPNKGNCIKIANIEIQLKV